MAKFTKIILIMSMAMIVLLARPLDSNAYSPPDYIKIGVKHGNTAQEECKISSPSGFSLGTALNSGYEEILPLPAYNELIARVADGSIELRDPDGILISADIGSDACLMPYGFNTEYINVNGEQYRGGVILRPDDMGKITVINFLTLEEYVYGVIHREIGQSSPLEALKAQAITARTFAALNKNRHSSLGFDLCADTHCQVYGGIKDEYNNTIRAADETTGKIIYCGNRPADTFYYKNSGGHTQNSEDVWSAAMAHLKGKPDPYCPEYTWKATITYDSLRQKLVQAGMDSGEIISAEIGGRNSAGAVSSLVIKGTKGETRLEKEKIRTVLGTSLVKSTHFTIENVGESADSEQFNLALLASDNKKTSCNKDELYLISSEGKVNKSKVSDLILKSKDKVLSAVSLSNGKGLPGSGTGEAPEKSLIFSGLGYGHGVGMAQDGAIEMARRGMSYMDILDFYYTGVEVY